MIIIESSAMVDALVGYPANPELLRLIATEDLFTPTLLDYEVASAIRGHLLGGLLTAEQAAVAIEDFANLTIERQTMTVMLPDIIALRHNFTTYDAAYVVLARTLQAPVVTADAKLLEARRIGVDVWLARSNTIDRAG